MNSGRKHYQTLTQLLQSIVRQIILCLCWVSLYLITHKRANLFTCVVTTSYQECHIFVSLVYILHLLFTYCMYKWRRTMWMWHVLKSQRKPYLTRQSLLLNNYANLVSLANSAELTTVHSTRTIKMRAFKNSYDSTFFTTASLCKFSDRTHSMT